MIVFDFIFEWLFRRLVVRVFAARTRGSKKREVRLLVVSPVG